MHGIKQLIPGMINLEGELSLEPMNNVVEMSSCGQGTQKAKWEARGLKRKKSRSSLTEPRMGGGGSSALALGSRN